DSNHPLWASFRDRMMFSVTVPRQTSVLRSSPSLQAGFSWVLGGSGVDPTGGAVPPAAGGASTGGTPVPRHSASAFSAALSFPSASVTPLCASFQALQPP